MKRTVSNISVIPGTKRLLSTVAALLLASPWAVRAANTSLPLRYEPSGTCIYDATSSHVAVEAGFGASVQSLAFAGSTSLNFYSPPIVTAPSLTVSDRCSGRLWITNGGNQAFSATIKFSFFDYDPHSGAEVLLGESAVSGKTKVDRRTAKRLVTPRGWVINAARYLSVT